MPIVSRSAIVKYSAQQMFDLINDIESYPQFLSGCKAAKVIRRSESHVEAKLILGKNGFEQQLITCNELQAPHSMIMRLVEGPFKEFEGRWGFRTVEVGCEVSLNLRFKFSNPLLALAASKSLEENANKQVDTLCKRADTIYYA